MAVDEQNFQGDGTYGGITYDQVGYFSRIITDCCKLGSDERIPIIKRLADGAKDSLVKNYHEEKELRGNYGKRKVEVKYLAGLARKRGEDDDGVREDSRDGWLHDLRKLGFIIATKGEGDGEISRSAAR